MTNEEAIKMLRFFVENDQIKRLFAKHNSEVVQSIDELSDLCIKALEKQATSDNASDNYEIVHCKDCRHWYADVTGCTENIRRCGIANYLVGGNGFCIYGEWVKE